MQQWVQATIHLRIVHCRGCGTTRHLKANVQYLKWQPWGLAWWVQRYLKSGYQHTEHRIRYRLLVDGLSIPSATRNDRTEATLQVDQLLWCAVLVGCVRQVLHNLSKQQS